MTKAAEPFSTGKQRHLSAILEFMTDIEHVVGKDNPVVDCLLKREYLTLKSEPWVC